MIAIEVKYLPATNTKPRRICAFTVNGQRLVMSASHADDQSGDSGNGQKSARFVAQSLADQMQWGDVRDWGGTVGGFVFCFPDKE